MISYGQSEVGSCCTWSAALNLAQPPSTSPPSLPPFPLSQVDKGLAGTAACPLPAPIKRLYYLNEFGQEGGFDADDELLVQHTSSSRIEYS